MARRSDAVLSQPGSGRVCAGSAGAHTPTRPGCIRPDASPFPTRRSYCLGDSDPPRPRHTRIFFATPHSGWDRARAWPAARLRTALKARPEARRCAAQKACAAAQQASPMHIQTPSERPASERGVEWGALHTTPAIQGPSAPCGVTACPVLQSVASQPKSPPTPAVQGPSAPCGVTACPVLRSIAPA